MRRIISFALFGLAPFLIALPLILTTAPWWFAASLALLFIGLISLYVWTAWFPRENYPLWSKMLLAVLIVLEVFFLLVIYEPELFASFAW